MWTKRLFALCFLLCAFTAPAANWCVRDGGTGNGTAWNNAWDNFSQVSGVNYGDTIYVAEGTYAPFTFQWAGVSIVRATTNNAAAGISGWSAAYDGLVTINWSGLGSQTSAVSFDGDNTTLDGQTWHGIKIVAADVEDTPGYYNGAAWIDADNVAIRYVWFTVPTYKAGETRMVNEAAPVVGRSGLTLSYCDFDSGSTQVYPSRIDNITIEYCHFHDTVSDGDNHGNIMYVASCNNGIFRWNVCWNWVAEGVYFRDPYGIGMDNWQIYGNVFRDPVNEQSGRPIEFDPNDDRPPYGDNWYVYNNTFVNVTGFSPIRTENSRPGWPGYCPFEGYYYNNIFYNCAFNNMPSPSYTDKDYNWYGGGGASDGGENEANDIINGTDPFVSLAGQNYRLSAQVAGLSLNPAIFTGTTDPDGNSYTSGTRSRGAYQFAGAGVAPTITSNNITGTNGVSLSYQIATTGGSPTWYNATNISSIGLSVNNSSGLISGTPTDSVTNQVVGLFASNTTGLAYQSVLATINPASAILSYSPAQLVFPKVATNTPYQLTLVLTNTGASDTICTGYVVSVSALFTVSPTNWSFANAVSSNLTVTYTPTAVASNYGTLVLSAPQGNQTISMYGFGAPVFSVTTIGLTAGLMTSPTVSNENNFVSFPSATGDGPHGGVSFYWNAPTAGYSTYQVTVGGTTNGSVNSFWVEATGQTNWIWDVFEETAGLMYVHNRGTGLYNAPQYTNYLVTNASAGLQLITLAGRETPTWASNLVITFYSTGGSDVTPPDTYTFDYPTNSGFTVTSSTNYTGIGGTAGDSDGELLAVYWTNATTGVSGTATGTTTWTNYPVSLNVGNNVLWMTAMNTNSLSSTTNITVYWAGTVAPVSGATLTGGTLKAGGP